MFALNPYQTITFAICCIGFAALAISAIRVRKIEDNQARLIYGEVIKCYRALATTIEDSKRHAAILSDICRINNLSKAKHPSLARALHLYCGILEIQQAFEEGAYEIPARSDV
jgi:hypothetical protein